MAPSQMYRLQEPHSHKGTLLLGGEEASSLSIREKEPSPTGPLPWEENRVQTTPLEASSEGSYFHRELIAPGENAGNPLTSPIP